MRAPAPRITFLDFGDGALTFEASFWSSLKHRKEIESEVRHRIAENFTEGGTTMAFPQRDVHLETPPLELDPPASPLAPPTSAPDVPEARQA